MAAAPDDTPRGRLVTNPSELDLVVHTLTLDELLAGAREGGRSHVGELHRRFGPDILRRLQAEDSTVTAAEILSDVFMRLPHALASYEDHGKFEAWLYVMAKHALADKRRKRRRLPDQMPCGGFEVADTGRPGRTWERNEVIDRLAACLAERPRAVWLRNLQGFTDQETAAYLGITANNVAQILFRARARIREEAASIGLTPSDLTHPPG